MQQLEAGASVSEAVSRLLELDEQYLLDEWDPDDMLPSMVNACTGEGPPLDQLRRNALFDMAKHWDFEDEERDVCIDDLLPFPDAPAEFAQACGGCGTTVRHSHKSTTGNCPNGGTSRR